jgi:hypothetical protein
MDIKDIIRIANKVFDNSKNYPLNVLVRVKQSCDIAGLQRWSIKINTKIGRRKAGKELIKEFKEKGIEAGTKIKCHECFCCCCETSVIEVKEEFLIVKCKSGDPISVNALKVEVN